ncbi:4'-phosphopantetheinyl transferase superfamily protein [Streptomyces sp. NPDC006458]|uniref:4'-phosphopantetheinyl transferase family protein n=1 Tax=Streptomyces sp. NPDC006458 TaxID=3154302 RepID=UPI0033BC1111
MIEEILPPGAVAAESLGDAPLGTLAPGEGLLPEEEPLVAHAVPARRAEFTTVRVCARRALSRLGRPPAPVTADGRGAPRWPAGVIGSLTHCTGYRAAALALDSPRLRSLGVDAEPHRPLPDGILETIALPAERRALTALSRRHPAHSWDRVLFSAKESVFKAWYPLTGEQLAFEEAELSLSPTDPRTGTFEARLLRPGPTVDGHPLTTFTGRWLLRKGLVLTAVAVNAEQNAWQ